MDDTEMRDPRRGSPSRVRAPEETDLEQRLRQMLRHLGRTLAEAISDSAEAHRVLEHLRAEGFGLYLLLDRHGRLETEGLAKIDFGFGSGDDPEDVEGAEGAEGAVREVWNRKTAALEPPQATPPPGGPEPSFRIDQGDLRFLRSIGIDPTRRAPRTKDRR